MKKEWDTPIVENIDFEVTQHSDDFSANYDDAYTSTDGSWGCFAS